MSFADPSETIVVSTADQRACAELALVLEARSIPARQERIDGRWILSVPADYAETARAELADYEREKRAERRVHAPPRRIGNGWPGAIVYVASLVIMTVLSREMSLGADWLEVGRMDSGRFVAGEWWRAVTALTLHADAAHLLANAAFGSFFGYALGTIWGGGFAWLAIVLAGTIGNAMNGLVTSADHRSIGASTAVFGALGLLTAYSWRRGFPADARSREKIAPIVAGLGLLAFTGAGGENTDIGAHLMGFVAGFAIGLVVARLGPPETPRAQALSGALALLVVAGAWMLGLVAA